MGEIDESLGQELRRTRRAKGETQDSLAAEMRVAEKTIGKWERCEVMPSATNIRALEKRGLIRDWVSRNGGEGEQYGQCLHTELDNRVRETFGCPTSELYLRISEIGDDSERALIAYFRQLPGRQRWSILDILSSMSAPASREE